MNMSLWQKPWAEFKRLWLEFLPLSLSDVTMAASDPMINTTLAHLPDGRLNIGALGVSKSLAVFFESPIIMLLHTSNALAGNRTARSVLFRFMLLCAFGLSLSVMVLTIPALFEEFSVFVLGLQGSAIDRARNILTILILWPALIAWRRYFQGLLIHAGHIGVIGKAGISRLLMVAIALVVGIAYGIKGETLAGIALISGLVVETVFVTGAAYINRVGVKIMESTDKSIPTTLHDIVTFYRPLATSMMVIWGSRTLLLALVARSIDGPIALAAWSTAWSIVLVLANSTRMTQQVIIRNLGNVSALFLSGFAASVGALASLFLLLLASTGLGQILIGSFTGGDADLRNRAVFGLMACVLVPFGVAMQNAIQGFLISAGKTSAIREASLLGAIAMLSSGSIFVYQGMSGVEVASISMMICLVIEIVCLAKHLLPNRIAENIQLAA